ncbi:tail assembly structural protein [Shewanella phage S0112]|nr:tail assembly structural protein [Shewanella phage S0112]
MGGSSSQTVGYRYFLGLHMAICSGPITSVNKIYVGKRLAWEGAVSTNSTIGINRPDLFGGDKKEGGIVGNLDVMFGDSTQVVNPYLQSQLGAFTPSFRGVVSIVFRARSPLSGLGGFSDNYVANGSGGGYVAAMSPYPKPWACEVTYIPGKSLLPAAQNINSGSANGAHIIYELLTNPDWGLGHNDLNIDIPSFEAAAQTLYDESFGLSLSYANQSPAEEFIENIQELINSVLYTDPQTGKFVLKLIRDDYDINTLPVFDETNIISLNSFERPGYAELVNEAVIKFRRRGELVDSSVTFQDLASIQAQGGVISQTYDYRGIDSDSIIGKVGIRALKQASTPLARVEIIVNRKGWDIRPGDVIKFSWDAYGIEQAIIRVVDIDYGTLTNGQIRIKGIEDIFGLPNNSYVNPGSTAWTDTIGPPLAIDNFIFEEVPYYILATTFSDADLAVLEETDCFVLASAEKPAQPSFSYQMHTKIGSGGTYAFVATGTYPVVSTISSNVDRVQTIIPVNNATILASYTTGFYGFIGDEIVRFDGADAINGTITLGRGCMDTIPIEHVNGDKLYFVQLGSAFDLMKYIESAEIRCKLLNQTSVGVYDINLASEKSKVLIGRQNAPYRPSRVKVNDLYFPTYIQGKGFTLTWDHQDRLQQTAGVDDWFTSFLGAPETGVSYWLRVIKTSPGTATILAEQDIGPGTTYNLIETGIPVGQIWTVEVRLYAKRDGESSRLFEHSFTLDNPAMVRITETGDTRITESNDRRILE